jgi:hypothetical protein
LCSCIGSVHSILQRTDFYRVNDASVVFLTVHDAVICAKWKLQTANFTEDNNNHVGDKNDSVSDDDDDSGETTPEQNDQPAQQAPDEPIESVDAPNVATPVPVIEEANTRTVPHKRSLRNDVANTEQITDGDGTDTTAVFD